MLYKFSDRVYYSKHRFMYLEPAIGYIKGDRISIMIDSGNSKEQIEKFFELLKENNLELPSYIILTHHHWDHSFGAAHTDIPLISSLKAKKYLQDFNSREWTDSLLDERLALNKETKFSVDTMKKVYPDLKDIRIKIPDLTKANNFSFDLGNNVIKFYINDNSHSDDAIIIHSTEDRVIFIGDSHSKSYSTNPMSFDKKKLRDYIDFIRNLDFDFAIPGHGNIYEKEQLLSTLEEEFYKLN
ncbi:MULTISPECIES: MBL fold metallo-hydrolase [unclassified Gemella]|uniref:MBL fold metallo-hydrolase n=1 Tax=unclassified Gemella TaxID=2624949 RepID=UPI001074386F|nr:MULTISPECIES: MBL fold metallo-hydrolase [unclassified Gemella]MBF0710261.1 MBL fold metallo-hydrolase [Gemella sp. GL1.1]MBF0746311.1 MBL fold metallo-hydrolase [Gemella sp. 19428wG2_WT2a]NYS27605.1 MBL fold metallo-hydrolase [Gemella sp. GL1]TFU60587.1 MBL fold metallo-hydrolase [Gemella sp. WT2a]